MCVVSKAQPVLRDEHQPLMNPLRIAVVKLVAAGIRAGSVRHAPRHNVLRIVDEVAESFFAILVADAVPVVGSGIAQEVGNRSVAVTIIEDHYHVVDDVVDIEQDRITGISRTVRIQSLHLKVEGLSLRIRCTWEDIRKIPEVLPVIECAICGLDSVAGIWSGSLNAVPFLPVAAEIRCAICRLGSFLGLEDTPILTVDVEVIISTASVGLAQ